MSDFNAEEEYRRQMAHDLVNQEKYGKEWEEEDSEDEDADSR